MMYLIAQTWLFLLIALLIGMVMMHFLGRNQKWERLSLLEAEALDARHRAITVEKEVEDYRARLAELEGLPASARASRIAAREEMSTRLTQLERELSAAQSNEMRLTDESNKLKADVDTFRTRYLEARAKWDEYQAKAEALAAAPPSPAQGPAQAVADEGMRRRVLDLEGKLAEVAKERDAVAEQARSLAGRTRELERQIANAAMGSDRSTEIAKVLQGRIAELEARIAQVSGDKDAALQQHQQTSSRVKDLELRLATAGEGFDKTAESGRQLQSRISELEASLVIAAREREAAEQKSKQLAERLTDVETQASQVGQRHEKASDLVRGLQARIAELESRLAATFSVARDTDALRSRVADLQDKLVEAEAALRKSLSVPTQDTEPLRARIHELEMKLAHAAATNSTGDTIAVLQSADNVDIREKLSRAEEKAEASTRLQAEVEALKARLAAVTEPAPGVDPAELRKSEQRTAALEAALAAAQRQASDVMPLRQQVAALERRLADMTAQADKLSTTSPDQEDVSLLKARLADMETRVMASAQSGLETSNLRSRISSLEAMLHEAAKWRDEASVLRSKVAELDGRLGVAMKAAAEAKAKAAQTPAV